MTDGVALFMRVQDQDEICIGHAATMEDVPNLLERVAALWRGRYLAGSYVPTSSKASRSQSGMDSPQQQ